MKNDYNRHFVIWQILMFSFTLWFQKECAGFDLWLDFVLDQKQVQSRFFKNVTIMLDPAS